MPKNKLKDLRDHLFETLERLTDKDDPMEVQRAVAISQVANAIINSAKLELRAVDILGQDAMPTDFLGMGEAGDTARPALMPAKKVAP